MIGSKISRALVTLGVVVSMISPAFSIVNAQDINLECKGYYADVKTGNNFCPYIEYLHHQGVNVEASPNYYSQQDVSRGIFAVMVVKAFDLPINTSGEQFTDVHEDSSYFNYVMTLKNAGVIIGYPDKTFRVNDTVGRGAAMKFIRNAARVKNPSLFPASTLDVSTVFTDTKNTDTFGEHIRDVYDATKGNTNPVTKVISGFSDRTFRADVTLSRGAIAKILANSMKYAGIEKVSCTEYYCQDKFDPGTVVVPNKVIDTPLYAVSYNQNWDELAADTSTLEAKMRESFTGIGGGVNQVAVDLLSSDFTNQSSALFTATQLIPPTGVTETLEQSIQSEDPSRSATAIFFEGFIDILVQDPAFFGQDNPVDIIGVETLPNGTMIYEIASSELDGYVLVGIKGNTIHMGFILGADSSNIGEMHKLAEGYTMK